MSARTYTLDELGPYLKTTSEYFSALGKFVHYFAMAEAEIHNSFYRFSGIDRKVAMAIKGSMRIGEVKSIIRRLPISKHFSDDARKDVLRIFEQFDLIATFRDCVIHRGAHVQLDGSLFSANSATTRTVESLQTAHFSLDDIKSAANDLNRMWLGLSQAGRYREALAQGYSPVTVDGHDLLAPWLYKPVELKTPNLPKKNPSKRRK